MGRLKEIGFKLTGYDRSLFKRLGELKPHLLHAHFGPDGVFAIPLARKLNIPLVVTFHGYDATVSDEYARKSFYNHRNYLRHRRQLQKKGDLFIAISEFIRGKMIMQGFPPERTVCRYIGINTERFTEDPTIEREPIVLFVGRLVENKGCEYLIQAMSLVQQEHPKWELVIIGEGPLRNSLELSASQRLMKYRFLGAQQHDAVKQWMNRVKIFSVPSVTIDSGASEGFGIVFLEASAMGLPVVSFATGGIPEAVMHGVTGFLAEEKDSEGLANYISRLISEPETWKSCSDNGKKRTREIFDLNEQVVKLEEIYETVIRKREVNK